MGLGSSTHFKSEEKGHCTNRTYQVCWIYISEIPTARLRGLNVSLGAATQWLFNLVIARSVPNMLVTMGEGGYGTFLLFSCFAFCFFIFVWYFVPETKVSGQVLELL